MTRQLEEPRCESLLPVIYLSGEYYIILKTGTQDALAERPKLNVRGVV